MRFDTFVGHLSLLNKFNPVLVVSHAGSGRDAKTVVAGTVVLVDESSSCMKNGFAVRKQSESDGVEPHVMRSITKVSLLHGVVSGNPFLFLVNHCFPFPSFIQELTIHFCEHSKTFPGRVLLFRDGLSKGNFPKGEIESIRQAFSDAWEEVQHEEIAAPSPVFEQPKITYVACVNQHGLQIVPSGGNGVQAGRGSSANVPSGTCVADPSLSLPLSTLSLDTDFLLTAQGGLKGTSKPVFYRELLNENGSLTPEVLQSVVFGLSFHYGTATKATRRLSVAQYSKRLAEQFLAYLPCK